VDHIGIDGHKKERQICILTEDGELIERRVRTLAEGFAEVLGPRPRARILLEASTESERVARCLEGLGHEVIVADPNFAPMYATRTRKVKTDRRDARALTEAKCSAPIGRLIDSPTASDKSGRSWRSGTRWCGRGRGASR
jgi:transposase